MLISEIQMEPVIMLGKIHVVSPPEMKRLGRIETVDEEEIRLPRGGDVGIILDGYFLVRGPENAGLGQLNPPVKHIIRVVIVLLQDRDIAVLIMIADGTEWVAGTMHGKRFVEYPECNVSDAVSPGVPKRWRRRGQGRATTVSPAVRQGGHCADKQDCITDDNENTRNDQGYERGPGDSDESAPDSNAFFHGFEVFRMMRHRFEHIRGYFRFLS